MSRQGPNGIAIAPEADNARGPLPGRVPAPSAVTRDLLSELDIAILRLVAEGYGMDAIARELNVSARTLRRHTQAMRDRFGARAPIQVAVWAARRGVI